MDRVYLHDEIEIMTILRVILNKKRKNEKRKKCIRVRLKC